MWCRPSVPKPRHSNSTWNSVIYTMFLALMSYYSVILLLVNAAVTGAILCSHNTQEFPGDEMQWNHSLKLILRYHVQEKQTCLLADSVTFTFDHQNPVSWYLSSNKCLCQMWNDSLTALSPSQGKNCALWGQRDLDILPITTKIIEIFSSFLSPSEYLY